MSKGPSTLRLPPRHCANCGTALRAGGRRSLDPERRYCMAELCQQEKRRQSYLARTGAESRPDAPTKCSNCLCDLPPRKVRLGDSPLGRWCSRAACLRHRAATEASSGVASGEEARLTIEFAEAALDPERTVTCEECGLTSAVVGFIHPEVDDDGNLFVCRGTGEKAAPRPLAVKRWAAVFERAQS